MKPKSSCRPDHLYIGCVGLMKDVPHNVQVDFAITRNEVGVKHQAIMFGLDHVQQTKVDGHNE